MKRLSAEETWEYEQRLHKYLYKRLYKFQYLKGVTENG